MTQTTALLWKEWRELRWFLVVCIPVFFGMPLADALRVLAVHGQFNTDNAGEMVLTLGALLAVLLAVAVSTRDTRQEVRTFWRSRPIGLTRWLLTKYLAGLAVLLAVCVGALIVQLGFMSRPGQWYGSYWFYVLTVHTFALVLIYSVAFLLGCLVRDAARTAILSFGAVLLIYFLPVLVRPLGWLSVLNLMEPRLGYGSYPSLLAPEQVVFDFAALVGSAAAFGLARLGVKRGWRLRMGARAMCWTLGLVALLLFGAAAAEIGSNLKVERIVPVFPGGSLVGGSSIARVFASGDHGLLLLAHYGTDSEKYELRPFDLSLESEPLGQEVGLAQQKRSFRWEAHEVQAAWRPERPDVLHLLLHEYAVEDDRTFRLTKLVLLTATLRAPDGGVAMDELDLLPQLSDRRGSDARMHCLGDTLYVAAVRDLIAIDIGTPGHPTVAKVIPLDGWGFSGLDDGIVGARPVHPQLRMLPVSDLEPAACFAMSARMAGGPRQVALEGDLLIARTRTGLTTYRLDGFAGRTARLKEVGRLRLTPLEKLTAESAHALVLKDGLAYALVGTDRRVQVYDVRQPEQPRRLGFYVATTEWFSSVAPLDDGRVLLGGRNLHVLAPPRLD